MKKFLLKYFPIEMLIEFLADWLASTIKRPNSVEARQTLDWVKKLRDLCEDFIEKVEVKQ